MQDMEAGYTEGEGLSLWGVGLYALRTRLFPYKVWALWALSLDSSGAKVLAEAIGRGTRSGTYIYDEGYTGVDRLRV